jgi:hypothetical protein
MVEGAIANLVEATVFVSKLDYLGVGIVAEYGGCWFGFSGINGCNADTTPNI